MNGIKISKENLENLETLHNVIEIEENSEVSLDEVLTRVLKFYNEFVPYN
ncbi:MAG: hypothetical protein NWE89_06290 [Candidatus Bathyarchaeota archaeon]|nr:hypothetical protein [Candidatus Bathyarchaeota archaeon]